MEYYFEYGIYRRINGGTPFCINTFHTLVEAIHILQINYIYEDEKRGRIYFVDNDFFNNRYDNIAGSNFNYYKIVVRKISNWCNIDELENDSVDKLKTGNKKIINFYNFA